MKYRSTRCCSLLYGSTLSCAFGLLPLVGVGCGNITEPAPDLSTFPQTLVKGDAIYQRSSTGYVVKVVPGPQGDTAYTDLEDTAVSVIGVGDGLTTLLDVPGQAMLLSLLHGRDGDAMAVLDLSKGCTGETPVDLGCVTHLKAPAVHDQLVVSPDGRFALSYISSWAAAGSDSVVVNLGEVALYDLETGDVRTAQPGTGIRQVVFSSLSATPFALILTQDQVVRLDLETGAMTPRELTLTTATNLTPLNAVLTDDEAFALVTLSGSADLFTFDLSQPTLPINILALSGSPLAMVALDASDKTLILSGSGRTVDVVNGTASAVERFSLPYPATAMVPFSNLAKVALYDTSDSYPYLHVLDLETRKVQTWLLDDTLAQVQVSPDGGSLVLFYGSLNAPSSAIALFNMAGGAREPSPIQLISPAGTSLFLDAIGSDMDQVFITLPGSSRAYVARFNLATLSAETVEVPPLPQSLYTLSDGRVVTVHASNLGMLSIFPPDDPGLIQFIPNFAPVGVL